MSRTAEQLRVVSDAPRTRVVPLRERTLRRHRIVAPFLGKYEADVFRTLRTLAFSRLAEKGGRTLGICSAREGEGKSMVALNLAISAAFDVNRTVLLVELAVHLFQSQAELGRQGPGERVFPGDRKSVV